MLDVLGLRAGKDLDAPAAVIGLEEAGQLLARHPRQHPRLELDHGGVRPQRPGRGGRLQPDIAAPHDGQSPAGTQRLLQPLGVGEMSQLQKVAVVRARQAQLTVRRAGGQDQDLVGGLAPAAQPYPTPLPVDRLGARPEPELDALVGVEGVGPEFQGLAVGLALEIGLRQRRPLIRDLGFLADQQDRAGVAVLAQQGRSGSPGVAGAHDDDAGGLVHPALRRVTSPRRSSRPNGRPSWRSPSRP